MFSSISKFFRNCICCISKKNKNVLINKKNKKIIGSKNSNKISKNSNKIKNDVNDVNDINDIYDINDLSYLDNINYKDTIPFIPLIKYGKVIKIYDGDTITIAAKLPFNESPLYRFSVRLAGIDSAEIKGGTKNETEIAIVARDALHDLIFGKIVELRGNGKEKYGRLLADLYYDDGKKTIHINKWMLDNEYAVLYNGGKKIKPSEWEK